MSAFLYFVPGHDTTVTLDRLRMWGLEYAFDRVPYYAHCIGPAGSGTLLCDDVRLEPLQPTYRPAEQTWQQQPGTDFWVGFYTDHKPRCEDLARDEQLPGERIELADGARWQVPLVRQTLENALSEPALPCYLDLNDEGEITRGAIVDQHTWLWQHCEPFWNAWLAGIETALRRVAELPPDATNEDYEAASLFSLNFDTLLADAVKVLSANYRVGLREAMALRLFRTDSGPAEILKIACDTQLATQYLQKKSYAATNGD